MNEIQDARIFSDAVQLPAIGNLTVGVIGLGYVGLPLAAAFGKKIPTIGFDINSVRCAQSAASTSGWFAKDNPVRILDGWESVVMCLTLLWV